MTALLVLIAVACREAPSSQAVSHPGISPDSRTLPDEELVLAVGSALWAKQDASGLESLSPEEQVVSQIYVLEAEVNNGGFEQFFVNSSGDLASTTPSALEAIGAFNAATLCRRALEPFGAAGPSPDRGKRVAQVESLGQAAVDLWNQLDQEFFTYPDNLTTLTAAYIRKHAAAIRNITPPKVNSRGHR